MPAPDQETDLFAGLDGAAPGPYGWGSEADARAAEGAAIGAP